MNETEIKDILISCEAMREEEMEQKRRIQQYQEKHGEVRPQRKEPAFLYDFEVNDKELLLIQKYYYGNEVVGKPKDKRIKE